MTVNERFERTLPDVLSDLYLGPTPDYRDDLLWQTARTRQRPAWSFPGRWLPMADIASRSAFAPRLPWRTIAVALLLIALLVAGAVAFIGSQQPKLPAPFGVAGNGLIAFEQAGDIVTLDPASGATRLLVGGSEQDSSPVYSSDGTKIAFQQVPASGDRALFVVNADGTNLVRVTPDPVDDLLDWTFSPDGRALLVTAMVEGQARIFEVASDGSRPTRTLDVQLPTDPNAVEAPRYRPTDSSQVLVTEWLPGASSRSLSLFDLDAGIHRTLIDPSSTSDIYGAKWSPNGEWISYGKFDQVDGITSRARIMAADGTGDRRVDAIPGTDFDRPGDWSNDSTRIIVDRGYAPDGSVVRTAVVPIDQTGRSVEIDCPTVGATDCGGLWSSWSPDDASLLGSIDADQPTARHLLADPTTGRVTEMPWAASGEGSWQRVGR
jgi:hypothetical protein